MGNTNSSAGGVVEKCTSPEKKDESRDEVDENNEKQNEWEELPTSRTTDENKALSDQVQRLELENARLREELDKLKADRLSESDEMLAQLDLLESEQKNKVRELHRQIVEKDALILSFQDEIKALKESHTKFRVQAELEKEKACEEAREETIQLAESQFENANELYKNLKKQFDTSVATIHTLENELEAVQVRLEETKAELADCKAKFGRLKSLQAHVEADAARKTQEHHHERDRLQEEIHHLRVQLKEEQANNRHSHQELTQTLADRAKLQKDHDEIKAMCEELMTMIEEKQLDRSRTL
jgi:chromosome segregation ATPase